jgi:hypothetical protein
MVVKIFNIYSGSTDTFQGEAEQVRNQLNDTYGFLARYGSDSLQDDLSKLSQQQCFMVSVED